MGRVFNEDAERLDYELMDAVFECIPMYPQTIRLYNITNALRAKAKDGKFNGRNLESGNMSSLITTMTYLYERYPFCEEEVVDTYTGRRHVELSRVGEGVMSSKKVFDIDGLRRQAMEQGLLKWRDR